MFPETTTLIRAAVAVAATACLAAASACGTQPDGAGNEAAAQPATCPGGEIRFGIEPYEDPGSLKPAYRRLADALGETLDCPVRLKIVQNYSAEVLAMKNGKLELAQFGPLGFVFAHRRAGAVPLVSFADSDGELTTYRAGIWVAKDSPIRELTDIKGSSLALSEPGSTSGDALVRQALAEAGLAPESDVKLQYTGGHPESLLALTNGQVDAAEINTQQLTSAIEAGHFDRDRYRRVWSSDPIPNDPITVREELDPEFRDNVRKAMTSLDPEDVAAIGEFLDVTPPGPLVSVNAETYQPLFQLAETLELTEKDMG